MIRRASAALLVGAIIAILGSMTDEDIQQDAALYCEMLALYESSGGEQGWPDYRNAGCVGI